MDVVLYTALYTLQITVHLHDFEKKVICLIASLFVKKGVPKCLAACDMLKECVFISPGRV